MEVITLSELASLAIVGTFVSVVVQFIKASSNNSPTSLRLLVIGLSVLAAAFYYFFQDTGFWTAAVSILAVANTIFLFIIKPLEESGSISK